MTYKSVVIQSAVAVGVVAIGGTILFKMLKKKLKRQYVKVGKVSKLFTYPLKACAAQELESAECTKPGIKTGTIYDRMWSVIDKEGKHIDQKEVPRLVLLHVQVKEGKMCIDGPNMEVLELDILDKIPSNSKIVKCKVFTTYMDAVDCGEDAAKWIQKYSGKSDLRLVQYVPELPPRSSDMKGLCNLKGEKYPILFQWAHSYLFLSEASVEELNSRLDKETVTHLNFRPNILISGCQAFDEDKWKYVKIGETATFIKTTACSRCAITTVNPDTGEKTDKEPIITLRKYRKPKDPKELVAFKYAPVFGMFYGLDVEGKVSVGDDVYAVAVCE